MCDHPQVTQSQVTQHSPSQLCYCAMGLSCHHKLLKYIPHLKQQVSQVSHLSLSSSRKAKMLKTLNLTDSNWTVPFPHLGSIGHVADFPTSCKLAHEYGFDAVNLDVDYVLKHGPDNVKNLLQSYGLQPAAFRFPIKLTDEADFIAEDEFERGLAQFTREAGVCAAAGFKRTAMHILPWSLTGSCKYADHFRLVASRLEKVGKVLKEHDVQLGLEFLGSYGNRRVSRMSGQGYDFVHTVEGIRCLAAAAGAESHIGIKFDVHHWWATGGLLEELTCLQPSDIVYVELNDSLLRPAGSKLDTPEFLRDQPGKLGNSDASGVLAVLQQAVGYTGPVVCEPFNRRMHKMSMEEAIKDTRFWMDKCFKQAEAYPTEKAEFWRELTGKHPYNPDPEESKVRAGGLVGEEEEKMERHEDKRADVYVGEGGIAFSEKNSEKAVIETMKNISGDDEERRKKVGASLVKHLHAFVKDVEPSTEEWEAGIQFLVEAGQWSYKPEKRHEWMFLSDTLGVTMLVDCINHRKTGGNSTEWTVQGPFHGAHQEWPSHGANVCCDGSEKDPSNPAVPAAIFGRVVDGDSGKEIKGAKVDFWLTATSGKYAVQDDTVDPRNLCGFLFSDAEGTFSFNAIKPTPYKVPEDGPGGALMSYTGRDPWRPAHLHFIIEAPGYQKVTTHLFVRDDPYLYSDAVFAVLDSLVIDWPVMENKEEAERLGFVKTPFTKVEYTFKLARD